MSEGKSGIGAEVIATPSGGGAVGGLGEAFSTNLNSGTGSYVVPLEVPQGHRQATPKLSLAYDSAGSAGAFGFGWTLPLLAVQRSTAGGVPSYTDADALLLDGRSLHPLGDGTYRPRVDEAHRRVRRIGDGWEITDKAGTRWLLGTSAGSRVFGPLGPDGPALAWMLEAQEDTSGNRVEYRYRRDEGTLYPEQIRYGLYRVDFRYEDRPDALLSRRGGVRHRTRLRCGSIEVHRVNVDPSLLRRYDLGYEATEHAQHSLLSRVQLIGFTYEPTDTGVVERSQEAPPLTFGYTTFDPARRRSVPFRARGDAPPPPGARGTDVVDLDGHGLPGILQVSATSRRYWSNRGDAWAASRPVRSFPAGATLVQPSVWLADMDGDGRTDVLVLGSRGAGYYPGANGGWSRPVGHRLRPDFQAADPSVRLADADQDGSTDAIRTSRRHITVFRHSAQDGWLPGPRAVARRKDAPAFPDVDFRDPRVRLARVTGDGTLSWVRLWATALEVWPTFGELHWDERVILTVPGPRPNTLRPERAFLVDVDGDGIADLLYVDGDKLYLWINQAGTSFSEPVVIEHVPVANLASVRVGDFAGKGTAGLLFSAHRSARDSNALRYLDFTADTKPYLLSRIDNGVGGLTQIDYGYSTEHSRRDRARGKPWETSLPFPVPVVDSYARSDLATGSRRSTLIRYHEGHYDGRLRKFRGFARVETIEEAEGAAARLTRHRYHVGRSQDSPGVAFDDLDALAGKTLAKETFEAGAGGAPDRLLRRESVRWQVIRAATAAEGTTIRVPRMGERTDEQLEGRPTGRAQRWTYVYDAFGNVVEETHTGTGEGEDLLLHSVVEYAYDEARWVMQMPATRTQYDRDGAVVACERFRYDGTGDDPLALGEVSAGLLRRHSRQAFTDQTREALFPGVPHERLGGLGYRQEPDPSGTAAWWIDERRATYTPEGELASVTDALGATTTIEYDTTGFFAAKAVNALGHVRTASYDPWLGTVRESTAWGGERETYTYTPLGHIATETRGTPSDGQPTVRYDYRFDELPIATVMERRIAVDNARTHRSVTYYDGLGEELQTRTADGHGRFAVSGLEVRNARGEVIERRQPYLAPSSAFATEDGMQLAQSVRLRYDGLGRAVAAERGAGEELRADYEVDRVIVHDAEDLDPASPHHDTPTFDEIDAWNRVTARVEHGESGLRRTAFRLDLTGRVTSILDPDGSVRASCVRDMLGRKISVDHVDAGVHRYLLDAGGNVSEHHDPTGRVIRWTYDALGRLLTVHEGAQLLEQATYDTGSGSHLVSRLARMKDTAGASTFEYDERGRLSRLTRTFDDSPESFSYELGYDLDGRRTRLTLPDGHEVTYGYDARGLLERVSGLFHGARYDAHGRRTGVVYDAGVEETMTYHAISGAPEEQRIVRSSDRVLLFGRRYEYSRTNHLLSVEDLRSATAAYRPVHRTFAFDHAYRLRSMVETVGDDTATVAYDFDNLDNLVRNGDSDRLFTFDGSRVRGEVVAGAVQPGYAYDPCGHLTSMPGQQLRFDGRGRLRSVLRDDGMETSYDYDFGGHRIRRRVRQGAQTRTTLWVGEGFEKGPDGVTRTIREPGGERRIVMRSGRRNRLLLTDILGNIVLAVEPPDAPPARREYRPYGRQVASDPLDEQAGFGGRDLDEGTGLYYFRRRWYDPQTGRFVTPDPIAVTRFDEVLDDPRALNPYAYANGNPLHFRDPLGLWSMSFWEGLVIVLVVVVAVAATILSAGALAPLLGVAASTMYAIAAGAVAGGMLVGGIIGGIQGGTEGIITGMLLGLSIAATVFIGAWFYGAALGLGVTAGFVIAGTLGAIQAAAFIPEVRQSDVYKGILGWSSWINPWAWPGIVFGGLVLIADVVVTLANGNEHGGIEWDFDASVGMVVTRDSQFSETSAPPAFNFGTFTWMSSRADATTQRHEAGHLLNNALFGLFAASNLVASGGHEDKFWEILAESNTTAGSTRFAELDELDWWG